MSNDFAVISTTFKRSDTVKQSSPGGPEFDLLNQSKQGDLLSIIDSFGSFLGHSSYPVLIKGLTEVHSEGLKSEGLSTAASPKGLGHGA